MYSVLFLWLIILILIIVLFKLLKIKKNYIVCFVATFFIILFVLNLQSSIDSAIIGSKLVVSSIIPTIFPFTVICNLLISYDGISIYSKFIGPLFCKPLGLSNASSFPIAASFLCGYPLGAKYSSDIYNLGLINKNEYQRLLNIASNAGPVFIIGSIGVAMLSNIKYGYTLLLSNYLSILIVGFLTKKGNYYSSKDLNFISSTNSTDFGSALKKAIENGISTTLNIAAFVIMFSVIINIIKNSTFISTIFQNLELLFNLPKSSLYNLFLGSIEFTNGCKLISTSSLPINLKLSLISFICSFSSLSVLVQVSSIISKDQISFSKYSSLKFIQGLISFTITYISTSLFLKTTPVAIINSNVNSTKNIIIFSFPIFAILITTLVLQILYRKLKNLHVS